jgi:pimeloyl-ACP methyl ester carboxylesterase
MSKLVRMAVNAVIRPPRANYDLSALPTTIDYPARGIQIVRHPVQFPNSRGLQIVGSYYSTLGDESDVSCVIYLHGNCSCQVEGIFLVPIFVCPGVSVFCLDFSGCGNSEGEYISLGYFEKDDVACAINFLRQTFHVGRVALWGRSMGAATTLFTLAEDPTVACAVCDSPFGNLRTLIHELVRRSAPVPGFLTSWGVSYLNGKIQTAAGFEIGDVNPVDVAPRCFSPIYIIHGEQDNFIDPRHSREIFDAYGGADKSLEIIPGNHNSERPLVVKLRAVRLIVGALQAPIVVDDIRDMMGGGEHHYAGLDEMMAANTD